MTSHLSHSRPARASLEALAALLAMVAVVALGCSQDDPADWASGGADRPGGGTSDAGQQAPDVTDFEDEPFRLTAPSATENFLFVANTTRGTLAKVAIEGSAVRISTLRVGAQPMEIVTWPPGDRVAVLNRGSSTVTVVDAGPGTEDRVFTVDVAPNANRLEITPDGAFVFAWYDHRRAERNEPTGRLSEVSVIPASLGTPTEHRLSVGVGIRSVEVSDDGERAYFVSDDGVSVVVLASIVGDAFAPPVRIALPGESISLGDDRDVVVAHEWGVAIARLQGKEALRFVPLDGSLPWDLTLPGEPTDVKLAPGAATAVVSIRETSSVGLVDLSSVGDGTATVRWVESENLSTGQVVIGPHGDIALVFSVVDGSGRLGILDLETLALNELDLRKGIRGVVVSPNGAAAVVLHTKEPGTPQAGESEEDIVSMSYAFTLVRLDDASTKLVFTEAQPTALAFDDESAFVVVADEGRGVRALEWVRIDSFGHTHIEFARTPVHVGVVPGAGRVYVSQTHELGRLALIDVETGEIREITGFELNALID